MPGAPPLNRQSSGHPAAAWEARSRRCCRGHGAAVVRQVERLPQGCRSALDVRGKPNQFPPDGSAISVRREQRAAKLIAPGSPPQRPQFNTNTAATPLTGKWGRVIWLKWRDARRRSIRTRGTRRSRRPAAARSSASVCRAAPCWSGLGRGARKRHAALHPQ